MYHKQRGFRFCTIESLWFLSDSGSMSNRMIKDALKKLEFEVSNLVFRLIVCLSDRYEGFISCSTFSGVASRIIEDSIMEMNYE